MPTIPRDARDNDNIFESGADSLQVLELSSAISHAMPRRQGKMEASVPTRIIYCNPTIEGHPKVLHQRLNASATLLLPKAHLGRINDAVVERAETSTAHT